MYDHLINIKIFTLTMNKIFHLNSETYEESGCSLILELNVMAEHQCPIIHWLNPKVCVNVKNDQLKVIKATLRLSQHYVHALVFEVGFCLRSLTTTKPIVKEPPIHLEHRKVHLLTILY